MPKIKANGIEIEYDCFGNNDAEAVLLISGLGTQMTRWSETFCQILAELGYRVIRFDNRDAGLSTHFDSASMPDLAAIADAVSRGETPNVPYTLFDMAKDAVGLLDALKIKRAHVVGRSMGGMIAQHMAIQAPQRLLTLTSVMSSSGAKGLPHASPEVVRVMLRRPDGRNPTAVLDYYVKLFTVIGSPAFPVPLPERRERLMLGMQRGFYPEGTHRQTLAVIADLDRADQLAGIRTPTLVLHGKADPSSAAKIQPGAFLARKWWASRAWATICRPA